MIEYFKPFLSKRGIRVIDIHQMLRRGGVYSHVEIMARIGEGEGCTDGKYSIRSFRDDIAFMKEFLSAPLHISNRGEYSYTRRFSLFPSIGIIDQDMEILENISSATVRYKDLPFFRDLDTLLGKLNPHHRTKEIVGFEAAPAAFGGIEHFEDVFWSIHENRQLELEYQRFGAKPMKVKVHPHYLKEYRHRWYLLAWNPDVYDYRVYALDRIKVTEEGEEGSFLKREDFDPTTHWQYSVGIIRFDAEPVAFSFEVRDGSTIANVDYLRTMPIHSSQTMEEAGEGYWKVKLTVHPTVELFREIRSFGLHNVRNIQPAEYTSLITEE